MNKNQPWNILRFRGTGTWNDITLKAEDVEDNGVTPYWPHSVMLTTAAAHNLVAGGAITIEGTDYYDGTFKILEVPETDEIIIEKTYVAEETSTNDTCTLTLAPKQAFEFGGFRLHLNAAAAQAAENLTVTLTAGAGTDIYDTNLYTKGMNGVQDIVWNIEDTPMSFAKEDKITFAWANGDPRTYGLEVLWKGV